MNLNCGTFVCMINTLYIYNVTIICISCDTKGVQLMKFCCSVKCVMHNKIIRFTHALLFHCVPGCFAIATGHSCYATFHELRHSSGKYLRSFHVLWSITRSSCAFRVRRMIVRREGIRLLVQSLKCCGYFSRNVRKGGTSLRFPQFPLISL